MKKQSIVETAATGKKTRYEGEFGAHTKRNRPAQYYRLSEKDHETIKMGLSRFVSVYQIAAKIGCGYSTLKKYIKENPELLEVQEDAQKGELEYVKGKLLSKISAGSLGAMCFYLERKGGWTNKQSVDIDQPIPNIVLGVIPDSELPSEGEPITVSQIVTDDENNQQLVEAAKKEERQEQETVARIEDAADKTKPPARGRDEDLPEDDDWGDDAPDIF